MMKADDSMYMCKIISDMSELKQVSKAFIGHYQWSKEYQPAAYAQMALLEGYGLVVLLTAHEKNPLRRFTKPNDPVYKDSALEFFVSFPPYGSRYINFEVNALGALLSGYGSEGSKKPLSGITEHTIEAEANIYENYWTGLLKIPMELINDVFKIRTLNRNDEFKCNFYKISEDKSIEHYASWARIRSEVPNFHLIDFFGKVVMDN